MPWFLRYSLKYERRTCTRKIIATNFQFSCLYWHGILIEIPSRTLYKISSQSTKAKHTFIHHKKKKKTIYKSVIVKQTHYSQRSEFKISHVDNVWFRDI